MNLKDCRENYYALSGSLSSVTRQLAFAGIAVCWVFSVKSKTGYLLDKQLVLSILFFCLGLLLDLLQYFYSSAAWGFYSRYKEKRVPNDDHDFLAPRWINWPTLLLYWTKPISVMAGFFVLFNFFSSFVF
ncbi:hypothetical protein [Photobacterium angustum]|uniref:hypothetical protein n=1 Tax=Photobacterium angustum TaxID=661 RepID=UPI0005E9B891|nr:hypothetical protein [Photobacterium angustum]KJG18388.1 hypothetical protein UA33_06020 [Photobacterium angustum]KJG20868.1 hypothetical protein UA39_18935 [Photobacterium angustum]KJG29262.1 hypothetical protein UA36_15635 [Photobacterium angustum]PSW95336.1 hypothetical protein C0W79_10720 [Photobacterium angustum]PSX04150.1 hypothetical protein C0W87_02425 [Photobacterium angustum]